MFFRRIRDLRDDSDKSQEKISELLCMARSVYGRYERGEREIPVSALMALADYYEVNLDYLVGRTNDSKMLPKAKGYQKLVERTLQEEKKE